MKKAAKRSVKNTTQRDWHDLKPGDVIWFATGWFEVFDAYPSSRDTVTVNAAKQCRRLTIPMVHPVTPFMDVIARIDAHTHAFIPCLIGQRKSLPDALSVGTAPHIMVLIGPEGDFTDEEVDAAIAHGAIPITLGPTTLKVETAAISTIAFITLYLNEKSMHPHHTC